MLDRSICKKCKLRKLRDKGRYGDGRMTNFGHEWKYGNFVDCPVGVKNWTSDMTLWEGSGYLDWRFDDPPITLEHLMEYA